MKYTGLCIKEALRLWPPAPNLQRTCTKDVESENFTIPKGVEIMVCNFIHLIN
jgi:cytochrome P450